MDEGQRNKRAPLSIFISYASKDELLRQRLEVHLSLILALCVSLISILLRRLLKSEKTKASSEETSLAEHVHIGLVVMVVITLAYAVCKAFIIPEGFFSTVLYAMIIYGLSFGLPFGLASILLSMLLSTRKTTIQPAEMIVWSWKSIWRSLMSSEHRRKALIIGLVVASTSMVIFSYGYTSMLLVGIGYGTGAGVSYLLLLGGMGGIASDALKEQQRTKPNEGMQRSLKNSLRLGLVGGVITGLMYSLSTILGYGVSQILREQSDLQIPLFRDGLIPALYNGSLDALNRVLGTTQPWLPIPLLMVFLLGGLLTALFTGGLAFIQHIILRFFLWRESSLPWKYSRFLDYAAERILLRKVGGGYIFVHQLLLDYFASLNSASGETMKSKAVTTD